MNRKLLDLIIIVSKLLTWGLSVLVIYWIILKLTNHSPTIEEVILAFVCILAGYMGIMTGFMFKMWGELKSMRSDFRNHTRECDRRFYALAKDFKNTDSEFRKHMMRYHKAKYKTISS